MKKIIFSLIAGTIILSQARFAVGQSPIAAATDSPDLVSPTVDKQIQNLKDKIASKVEELRKKDEKATAGSITEVKDGIISFTTIDDQKLKVKSDDSLTKIYQIAGTVKKEKKLSDLKKGDYIIVTGPLMGETINANFIYQDEQFLIKAGKVTEVNKDNYYIKVLTNDKDNYTLDFETYSKTSMLNVKTMDVEKVGFSKIKEADVIHFVVSKNEEGKEKNRYPVSKVLIIPQEYFVK